MNIQKIAEDLLEAEKNNRPIEPLTNRFPTISVEDAYNIQLQQIEKKVTNGATIVGKKIGLTSKVMQNMFQV